MKLGLVTRIIVVVCLGCFIAASLTPVISDAAPRRKSKRPAKPKPPKINLPQPKGPIPTIEVAHVDAAIIDKVKESAARIDSIIDQNLKKHGIEPNPESTDEQYVRRAYLDITGTIPTARETKRFLISYDSNKRTRLIDRLLNDPGYGSHFFNYWADIFRLRDYSTSNTFTRPFADWLKHCFHENVPYDKLVHDMLTAEGKTWENPAVGFILRDPGMPLDTLNNTTRIFLGTRIGCAQCHDHPFDRWTQKEFYEMAAFIGHTQTRSSDRPPKGKKPIIYELNKMRTREAGYARRVYRYNSFEVWENDRRYLRYPKDYLYDDVKPGTPIIPVAMFGETPALSKERSRREALATWMVSRDNPRFTRTIANRLWKRAFGVGLIEPEDDMTDQTVASNPALMAFLEEEMKRLNYDLKEFQRIIFYTKAYQRAATMEQWDMAEPYHFQGPLLRRMSAEQIWDSLLTLTLDRPDAYQRTPVAEWGEFLTIDQKTETVDSIIEKGKKLDEAQKAERARDREFTYRNKYIPQGILLARASELEQPLPAWHFIRQFGQSDRNLIADSNTEGTVPQLLTMFNGPPSHMLLEYGSVIYNAVNAEKYPIDRISVIFLSLLNREPTREEKILAMQEIRENDAAGYGNIIWALLNTREFLFIQ